jgi:hypothetical protein
MDIVMVKQPVLVPPSFRMFSAGLHLHMIQNLQVVMLVHRWAWRNKLLVNIALTVFKKKNSNMLLMFDRSFATFEPKELLKNLCFPCGIVTESCCEHFMRFRCSFPELEAKFHANALFQISHFTYNRKSRITLNMHKNKH